MQAKRVLVVDDDPSTLAGVSELLFSAGYEPVAVVSFREAIGLLRSAPPDLLITDIRLQEFNGLQLVIQRPSDIPAIVLTGFQDPVLEQEALRNGAAFLLKPFAPQTLLQLVREKLPLDK